MSSNESKKVKRRKNKKNNSKPVSNPVIDGRDMSLTVGNLKTENVSNVNNLRNNSEMMNKLQQMMDADDDPVITLNASQETNPYFSITDKCLICHKEKSALPGSNNEDLGRCDDDGLLPNDIGSFSQSSESRLPNSEALQSFSALTPQPADITSIANICLCPVCKDKRELQHEREIEVLQLSQCWSELRQALHQVYQDVGLGWIEEKVQVKQLPLEKLKKIVHRLCLRSPHQLFLWLESQGRELVIGMKIKLLKHLSNGTRSPQLAKVFITDMLDDYTKLCSACKKLHPILKELEQNHLEALSLNWDMVIRHLFQSLVYLDNRVQYALPSLITQLRSVVDNEDEQKQLNALLHKYLIFDEQMTIVSMMWREVDPIIHELNMEQAELIRNQQMLQDSWDLYKMQRKILEQQMLKNVDMTSHRCSCEDCTLKYMLTCRLLPHTSATPTLPDSDIPLLRDTGGHYIPNSFMSSVVNNTDSLESVLCGVSSTTGLPSLKDNFNCSSSTLHSANVGCVKGPYSVEDDIRFWTQTVSHASANSSHVSPLSHQHCILGCPSESNDSETDLTSTTAEIHSNHIGLSNLPSTATDHACPVGKQSCQCPLCVPSMATPNSGFTEKQPNASTVEKNSMEHPCECHVCVQHVDRATIPTVVSAPPRPAALHLYPHIHGSYTVHTLHNSHVVKSFLPANVYGVHLPTVPCSRHTLTDTDSSVSHSVLQECLEACNENLDLDIAYENAKLLLNSRKVADGEVSVSAVNSKLSVSELGEHIGAASVETHLPTIGSVGSLEVVDMSPKISLENESTVPASSNQSITNTTLATHSNKGTQASGSLGCSQAFSGLAYSQHDYHHLKLHPHDSVSSITANEDISTVLDDQCATKCDSDHTSPCMPQLSMTNGKASLYSYNVAGHHNLTPNKHPCKAISGVVDSRHIPLANHCASPSDSTCNKQDLDSFPGDNEEIVDDSCSEQSSSTSTSNQKDNKHCDCCYCEVFGHDVTALPPVSRNYTEMREKLRQRLNKKKMESKDESNLLVTRKAPLEDCRDLDSLISFINGSVPDKTEECGSSTKVPSSRIIKKTSKRQRKVESRQHKSWSETRSCSCHTAVHDENTEISNNLKSNNLQDSMSFIESCSRWVNTSAVGSTNAVETITTLSENDCISMELVAGNASCENQYLVNTELKMKCVHSDCRKRTKVQNDVLCKLKSAIPSDNDEIDTQKERELWPSDKSSEEACLESTVPSFKSQLLAPHNSPLMSELSTSDKICKKKRKANHQTLSLVSTSSSSSSSSSSGVSSCGSNSSSLKEENFVLNVLDDFKKLHLSLASKNCVPSSPQNSSKEFGNQSVETQSIKCCPLEDIRKCINTPPLSPTIINDECKVSEIKHQRRHPLDTSTKINESMVLKGADSAQHKSTTNSVLPIKVKLKKEDKRNPISCQNCASNPYLSLLKPDELCANSGWKPNEKIPVSCIDLSSMPVKSVDKNKRSKKKQHSSSHSNIADDVFVPRDIDLDNGELDEMERELEAFKRFCWNSVPLANKEKVNVNLKDIIIRKKTELGCS